MSSSAGRNSNPFNCFEFKSIDELVRSCVDFYESSLKSLDSAQVFVRRTDLSKCVQRFHEDCGTLTSSVKDGIDRLREGTCVVLMTAHQPNLFAYAGVVRKATLSYVLQKKLARYLNQPVVSLFGIADHDFTNDRWVRSAQFPDVERRQGFLELRFRMPEKMMLNRIAKPSAKVLDDWRNEIVGWLYSKLGSIKGLSDFLGLSVSYESAGLFRNFEDFWDIVTAAHERAKTFSDFNAFIMSDIVNGVWGYDTLFFRFSESQQIFEEGFRSLLSNFNDYSRYVKESLRKSVGGVYEQEYRAVPFWYHCDCGSKVRLIAERRNESLIGRGECLRCGDTYLVDLGSYYNPDISGVLPRISARALSMPLVFFDGLKICCYVGGLGGREYLDQARYVAEHLNRAFPPVVIWRPKDNYLGVAQLEALMYYRKYSGTFDVSQYSRIIDEYENRIQRLREESRVNQSKIRSLSVVSGNRETDMGVEGNGVGKSRKNRRYLPEVVRDLKLLENVATVLSSHFCIVDYAVNVGLRSASEQWMAFLEKGGSLSSNISLETGFDDLFPLAFIEINRE